MDKQTQKNWFVSKPLRIVLGVAIVLAIYMLTNTLYLLLNRLADGLDLNFFAVGKTSIPPLFQAMILSHTGVGILLVLLMSFFGIAHLPKVWRMYKYKVGITGIAYILVGLTLGITGLFILTSAASRQNNWAWWIHVICAALAPTGYILHRLSSRRNRPTKDAFKRFGIAILAFLVVLIVWHVSTNRHVIVTEEAQLAKEQGLHEGPGAKNRVVGEFLGEKFVPVGFVPPESPFFPSAATTTTGGYLPSRIITRNDLGSREVIEKEIDEFGFVKKTAIGATTCSRCHPDIVAQWESSAHRFASFNNPFYEATITDMREHADEPNEWIEKHTNLYKDFGSDGIGRAKSKWCSGCHDPALMLAGKMNKPIDRRLPEAQAGLTCLSCHAIDKIHNLAGNGNYNIADEQEDPYLFANSKDGTIGAFLHDAAIKAKPDVHIRQLMKPFFSDSEFCLSCHKVSLPQSVNNYRWLRGQNDYDNWHDSGVALNASRTFYLPSSKRNCQDCHMPQEPALLGDVSAKDGMVKSHRFLAVNTALPYLRNDTATIKRIEEFLQDEKLRVDIFALKTENQSEPFMPINRGELSVRAGEKITVDVVVRNIGVGHTFPGGTNDSNEGWLEFALKDEKGITLAISGYIDSNGHLDSMTHAFKAVIVDKNSNPIHKRNAQDIHVVVYSNVIGPGTADIAHYSFEVPDEMEGQKLTMEARLLWRKFNQKYLEFAYNANPEGFKQFEDIPKLPITEIAKDRVDFTVTSADTKLLIHSDDQEKLPEGWIRYNDYGIGLLLEGDTRGATRAFEMVKELQSQRLDGYLNLAKTALTEGNLEIAYKHLKDCENIKSGDPQVAWVWGRVRQEDGLYEDAIAAYSYVLKYFPEDRAAWRQLGRTCYLDQKYQKSIEAYQAVLEIDPEDREAYYHLALNYRVLGNEVEAVKMEKAFEYYKIDESAFETAKNYRQSNPGDNLMTQGIRIHKLDLSKK
ncbi:tetratricopeptide repeat protein [Sunxiuqinia sp. A32]|uniref:tetratricopeptide repeat protein n=1 Tax=Sunxiuqinia sp. A32 TaxID=3461496 RepID=UPI00404556ED